MVKARPLDPERDPNRVQVKRYRELTLIASRQVEDDGHPTRTRGLEHESIALFEPLAQDPFAVPRSVLS